MKSSCGSHVYRCKQHILEGQKKNKDAYHSLEYQNSLQLYVLVTCLAGKQPDNPESQENPESHGKKESCLCWLANFPEKLFFVRKRLIKNNILAKTHQW